MSTVRIVPLYHNNSLFFTRTVKIPSFYHKTHTVLMHIISLAKVTEFFPLSGSALQGFRERAFQV